MLEKLAAAGMDIVRLNMSHGDHESAARVIKHIKTLNRKVTYPIAILLDTQGPEIRTGDIANDLELKNGSVITISVRDSEVEESSIHIDYAEVIDAVEVGDRITVDNGIINFEVLAKNKDGTMQCKVIDGGILKSKRHVNLPGIRVNLPAITKKDKADILFAIEQQVDFIALSFVREAQDIRDLNALLGIKAGKIKVIAKIEDQSGVENLDVPVRSEATRLVFGRARNSWPDRGACRGERRALQKSATRQRHSSHQSLPCCDRLR